ncbi:MAG: hypothetical protein ACO3B4_04290 [Burkholderiaceae bacterium]
MPISTTSVPAIRLTQRWALLLAAGLAVLTSVPSVSHAALGISPPQLFPDRSGIVVTEVQSSMTSASRWSVRLVGWGPAGEEIVGVPGDVSPRFFGLAPGGRQLIRARIKEGTRYHRLLIEQIPEANNEISGLAFRFRFSLPVYHHRQEPLAVNPAVTLAAGSCASFRNPEKLVVRLALDADIAGPQTLLPGETAQLCRKGAPRDTVAAESTSPANDSAAVADDRSGGMSVAASSSAAAN